MTEPRKLWIAGPAGRLECMLRLAPDPRALAVLAHPHPLFGGTLHNPVVFHSDRELFRRGFATLRFNFRGAGESEGTHDEGRGEVTDVGSAASWLRGLFPELPLLLVGYSFGGLCSLRYAAKSSDIHGVVAIGLPVRVYDMAFLKGVAKPLGIVQGERDEYGAPDEVERTVAGLTPAPQISTVAGATHLFPGQAKEAATAVVQHALRILDDPSTPE